MYDVQKTQTPDTGYRVSYEQRIGTAGLLSKYFPPHGQPAIENIEDAEAAAKRFSDNCGNTCCNVHVIRARDFVPVGSK